MILVQKHNHIGAGNPFKRDSQGFFQAALIIFLDIFNKIEQDFRVRVTFKMISLF